MTLFSARVAICVLAIGLPARAAEPEAPLNPLHSLDKSDLKAFVEQPLFDPARRLPAIFAPVGIPMPTNAIEPPPNVRLLGLVHGATDVALVRGLDNKTSMVSTGDLLGGWTVAVMPPNGLRLTKGHRAYEYTIFAAMGGPMAVTADPPAESIEERDLNTKP